MPFVEKRLISPTSLTTSASTALYTVPAGYTAIVKQIVVTNTTGTAATFTMYIGAASAGNALFSGTSVAANDTVIINLSQVLGTGEILRALSGTNAALNLTVSGVENDGPLAQNAMYIADNAITSAKIADVAIVNADINASAAIEQSKVANLTSDLALKAPLASPTFTGAPLAPTATAGTNTTQLATTEYVTTATAGVTSGFRNAIINGDFRVWQRGTSIGGYAYTADRWLAYQAASVNTISRQAASLSGFQYCARVQRNSGATNTGVHYLVQAVETINSYRFQGMTATLSFYARAGANYSSASSLLGANIETSTGVDQSYIAAWAGGVAVTSSKTLTTSWQRFTVTGAVPAGATQVGVAFSYTPVGTAGANDYFEVTGVQLEVAPQATPFEQRLIGTELSLCQRYYWSSGTVWNYFLANNSNQFAEAFVFKLPVTMRATPTLTNSFTSNDNASLLNSAVTTEYVYIRETCGNATYPYSAFTYSFIVSAEF